MLPPEPPARVQMLADFYYNHPAIQLRAAERDGTWQQKRRRNAAAVFSATTITIVPLLPLLLIALWNALKPRRAAARWARHGGKEGAAGGKVLDSDSDGSPTLGKGTAMVGARGDERAVVVTGGGDEGAAVRCVPLTTANIARCSTLAPCYMT